MVGTVAAVLPLGPAVSSLVWTLPAVQVPHKSVCHSASVSDPDPCGSVSEMAPLDPDPYWEYGSGSGSRKVIMVSKKGKKSVISS